MKFICLVMSVLFLSSFNTYAQEYWYPRDRLQHFKKDKDNEFIKMVYDTMSVTEESEHNISLDLTYELITTTAGNENYYLVKMWGPQFKEYIFFGEPTGISIDNEGYVYVTDFEYNRIKKFTPEGKLVTKWGSKGDGEGEFNGPFSVAVDQEGYVYVTDVYNQRIQKFTSTGEFVTKWGSEGGGEGEFMALYGIAVDKNGYVYVNDAGNRCIHKFTSNGEYVTKWKTRHEAWVKHNGIMLGANQFAYAALTGPEGITGQAIYSGFGLGPDDFPAEVNENIALIERGDISFAEKVRYAQDAGAIGVIIYNNEPGNFWGTLGTEWDEVRNREWIPCVSVSKEDGQMLVEADSPIITLGIEGDHDSEIIWPYGITVDQDGYIYLSDAYSHRIHKFTSSGEFLTKWGSEGDGEGQFNSPTGIAVDENSFVYVVDTDNHRIQKFTSDGEFVTMCGSEGDGESEFKFPLGIAVNQIGYIYVVDLMNSRIQQFTLDAIFISMWGEPGPSNPENVTITYFDRHGQPSYEVNAYGALLKRYYYEGAKLDRIRKFLSSDGHWIRGAAINSGNFLQVAVHDFGSRSIQKFNSEGVLLEEWCGGKPDSPYSFWGLVTVATDKDGYVYIADRYHQTVFDDYGHPINSERKTHIRIRKFDPGGDPIPDWNISFGSTILPYAVADLAIDEDGYIYVALGNAVRKYNKEAEFLVRWGSEGNEEGEFKRPSGIVVDKEGYVYVADRDNHRVQKFTSDGEFVTMWGSEGFGEGEFNHPHSIVIDQYGDILVTDEYNHRVQKFTSGGEFATMWGSEGDGDGEFNRPHEIVVDQEGYVYVIDFGNIRIQKFKYDGEPISVDRTDQLPIAFSLFQNYPNPFNPSTSIRYGIPERSHVIMEVYNILGQKVTSLVNEEQDKNFYEVYFDASHLPSGLYIYRLQAGDYVESRKMLYLK